MLAGPEARRSPSETNYQSKVDCAGETVPCAVFSYVRTDHTVTKVSKSEYDACWAGSDAQSEDNTSGLTTVTLAAPGMHYFICTMPDHCDGGMKLAVNVSENASSAGNGGLEVTTGTNAGGGGALLVPVMAPAFVAAATGALGLL